MVAVIDRIRRKIREDQMPYFEDGEIEAYLKDNDGDERRTIYELLIVKSEDTTMSVSGLNTQDTSSYFRRLAKRYRPNNSGTLR